MTFQALLLSLGLLVGNFSSTLHALASAPQVSLFGTGAVFSADNSAFIRWNGMLQRFAAERHSPVCASAPAHACVAVEWDGLVEHLKRLGLRAKIDAVNAAINRYPYVPSLVNWQETNRWETPFEFLRKGGQCQDYAITKYLLLRAAGVPPEKLRVVVLRNTRLGIDHAVTVAYVGSEALVLDNVRLDVMPASQVHDYRPYYSINEQGWWLHRSPDASYAAHK